VNSRKWVVNASPVILLGKIDQLELLEILCDTLVIPGAVADEILAGPHEDAAQRWVTGSGASFIQKQSAIDAVVIGWDLGAGETAVLSWARRYLEYEAILDDRAARDCAATLKIPVRGTLGVILLAKKHRLIPQAKPLFDALNNAGLRISPTILDTALRLAEEIT